MTAVWCFSDDPVQVWTDWPHSLQHHSGDKPQEGGQQQEVEVSGKHQRKHQGGLSGLHVYLFVRTPFLCPESDSFTYH